MEIGIAFLALWFMASFGILAAYKVRHAEVSMIQIVKSWFK